MKAGKYTPTAAGRALKEARVQLRLTVAQLAALRGTGIQKNSIYAWESGMIPLWPTLDQVASATCSGLAISFGSEERQGPSKSIDLLCLQAGLSDFHLSALLSVSPQRAHRLRTDDTSICQMGSADLEDCLGNLHVSFSVQDPQELKSRAEALHAESSAFRKAVRRGQMRAASHRLRQRAKAAQSLVQYEDLGKDAPTPSVIQRAFQVFAILAKHPEECSIQGLAERLYISPCLIEEVFDAINAAGGNVFVLNPADGGTYAMEWKGIYVPSKVLGHETIRQYQAAKKASHANEIAWYAEYCEKTPQTP